MRIIVKATVEDYLLLSKIGSTAFIESHGHSAPPADINQYVYHAFNSDKMFAELSNPNHIYHIIYHNNTPAGYSKLVCNAKYALVKIDYAAKLERLYLLETFHHLKLGLELLNFNIAYSKQHQQSGIWLFVWIENTQALRFYQRAGFRIIGSHDFKISETHSNPNYQMLLKF